ncbi:homoserine dehydrogenase [Halorhabdus sp. CBA1104]|uniref:homoserine dehydrogenase n=1 Tax=Halorhabdus sp. CBA1104 TaxID=1380432 RepID=UPI0012B37F0E|nr:homoserine dehydrogenase [Halorhabdus sp. CBA1104]QGN06259.1 homoserine dehydrogenase [Halorhabdus sp. CBA1104]
MDLAIMGTGTVGSSVAELAAEYGHTVTAMANVDAATIDPDGVDVTAALDRQRTDGMAHLGDGDPDELLAAEYDALIEVTPVTLGDAEPGFSHVEAALEQDNHVVLANKGPMAERYADVRALERQSAGSVRFEATVAGAIPVLSTIEDYGPGTMTAVRGILNGTANFILSRMAAEGLDYEHVLAEAQDLGVAETDPSFDVEGTDAALKCVILANVLAQGDRAYTLEDATVEGIKDVPGSALELAREDGRTIRLVGEVADGEVRVGPRLVPEHSELAVTGTTNIVQLETENAGRLNLSGRGAGGPETATAILSDVGRLE